MFLLFPIITFFFWMMLLMTIIIITSLLNSVSPSLHLVAYTVEISCASSRPLTLFIFYSAPPALCPQTWLHPCLQGGRRHPAGLRPDCRPGHGGLLPAQPEGGDQSPGGAERQPEVSDDQGEDERRRYYTRRRTVDLKWKKKIMIIIIGTKSFRLILFTSCLQPLTCPSAPSLKWLTSLWTR